MYGTYELWLENFLEPVIKQCLDKLNSNGVSCWSIKNFKTDKKLISGIKIQVGSLLIDTSVSNKLKKIKQSMIEI